MQDATKRFSDRVVNYLKFRPSYPRALLDDVCAQLDLRDGAFVAADMGSGTGLFSQLLLERGAAVYGVEPNDEMRE